jgi:Tfp pilus assembly protein PilN
VEARRGRRLRSYVALALVALVLVMAGWTVVAKLQTSSAQTKLDQLAAANTALQAQQSKYAALVAAQSQSSLIESQLKGLMADDIPWSKLITQATAVVPAGIKLIGIDGTLTAGGSGVAAGQDSTQIAALGTAKGDVGAIVIEGSAPDKDTVANYMDALAALPSFNVPFVQIANGQGKPLLFIATVLINNQALGGRFTAVAGSH